MFPRPGLFTSIALRRPIASLLLCWISGALIAQTPSKHPPTHSPMPPADTAALHSALDAYDQGNAQQAEPALRALVQKYPANYEANEALGSLYAEAGDLARALPYLQQSCAIAPREALAHANLGAAYLKLRQSAAAVHELQQAAVLNPSNGLTQSNLGQALVLSGDPKAAAKAFAIASKLSPDDTGTKYNWALALYDSGSNKAAADLLESLPSAAMTDQVHSLAGDAEERAREFQKALSHFQAAARLNPSDANLYALTTELLRHWTWREAIQVAHYGSTRYPASTHFKLAEGIGFYGDSAYRDAVRVFSELLQTEPENAAVADLLGRSCTLLADGDSAGCGGLHEFAERHPGNAVTSTYAAVAILHEPKENQNLDEAARLLHSAIKADPRYAEAYYQLGVLEQTRLDWKQSAIDLEQSIALRPKSPEAHYRLSRAYNHLGKRDEAQAEVALHEAYSQQAKDSIDARMQEVVRFLLKPS